MSNADDDDLTSQCLSGAHVLVFGQDSVALSFVQINEKIVGIPKNPVLPAPVVNYVTQSWFLSQCPEVPKIVSFT